MRGSAEWIETPSSSLSSRRKPENGDSSGSSLPPGDPQPPARCLPAGRYAQRIRPAEANSAPATTCSEARDAAASAAFTRERAVAVLVLAPRTARARLIAAHLARIANHLGDRLRRLTLGLRLRARAFG